MPKSVEPKAKTGGEKVRQDGQLSGLAGEFFVAAELLKRGFQTSVTFGNPKAIDLVAIHPASGRVFSVHVKTLRTPSFFILRHDTVKPGHIYGFTILHKPGKAVEYYVVPGTLLADHPERFGKSFTDPKRGGFPVRHLREFQDNWQVFEEQA